jgi:cellulose synthase/poly-beta-1,6-N-acetylglucosamine synthase-like glycosyltransferase
VTDLLGPFVRVVLVSFDSAILVYFVLVNAFYAVLTVSSAVELRQHRRDSRADSRVRALSSELLPRVSMLVPAHNESATIESSLQALLTLAYPRLEIVVVDDGSRDDTLAKLIDTFELSAVSVLAERPLPTAPVARVYRSRRHPNLLVAAKANGGKADALNAALNLASGELVCAVDADTIIETGALRTLVGPFIRSGDVVAAGATIRVANGCVTHHGRVVDERAPRTPLAGLQAVEYLRAFLFGRVGWNRLGGNLVISGAFGLFRRDSLTDSGGYARTVGEDMELVVRLRRLGYEQGRPCKVTFVPDPVAWTEAPERLATLGRQRDRWHRGLSDTLWRHRRLFLNPRYGALGLIAFPTYVLVEWFAPIAEAAGVTALLLGLAFGVIDVPFALLFFLVAYGFGVLLSTIALLLEEATFCRYGHVGDRLRLVLWALVENLGYRQLTVYWRLRGIVGFVRGRTEWGAMERQGFTPSKEGSVAASPLAVVDDP